MIHPMNTDPLNTLALAVTHFEGNPGDRNYKNNNPGNLKFMHQHRATGEDQDGFAIFPYFQAGFAALRRQIVIDTIRHPDWTLRDFVDSWAPPSDGNHNNEHYANALATALKTTPNDTLHHILDL